MTKIISSNESEMEVENVADGILMTITDDQGIGFTARITLTEDQAKRLKEGLDELLTERWETQVAAAPLDDPTMLEARLSQALNAYLVAEANWEAIRENEPKRPYIPDGEMTVPVYVTWKRECDVVDFKIAAWKTNLDAAWKEMTRRHNALGDVMPDAVKLVIPALDEHYSVWFTEGYSDISNLGSKYRSQIGLVTERKKKTDQEIAEGMA